MLKTVSTHTNPLEANIQKGRLEQEGIPATVAFENHVWMNWLMSTALGGVRVQVPHSFYEQAMEVIEQIDEGYYESELDDLQDKQHAERQQIQLDETEKPINWSRRLAIFFLLFFHIPIPFRLERSVTEHDREWVDSKRNSASPLKDRIFGFLIAAFGVGLFLFTLALFIIFLGVLVEQFID